MAISPDSTSVTLASREEGAYRVTIVGEDPANVTSLLVMGHHTIRELSLPPGNYRVKVEDLSRATWNTLPLVVSGDRRAVTVNLDEGREPLFRAGIRRPSRPSRRGAGHSASSEEKEHLPSADPKQFEENQTRRLAIGLSVDTRPDGRGGWRAAYLPAKFPATDQSGVVAIEFDQPADWRERPKWRLTIAIEGDQATQVPLPLFRDGVRVELSVAETPAGRDIAALILPLSARVAGLVGGLRRGAGSDSRKLVAWSSGSNVDQAIDALAQKMSDPWAAAAAALVLVRDGEINPVAHWAANLADRFPWLADAGVVAAWAHAAVSEDDDEALENACLERLVNARRRGSLYFSASNALAIEMLSSMVAGGAGANISSRAHKELSNWTRWTRRLVRGGAFVSWEEKGGRLTSGSLPSDTYETLAIGSVSAAGVQLAPNDSSFPQSSNVGSAGLRFATVSPQRGLGSFSMPAIERYEPPPQFRLSHDEQKDVWRLVREGANRTVRTYTTKADAIAAGRLREAVGKTGGAVRIYSRDGRIQEERTFPKKSRASRNSSREGGEK